MACVRIVQLKWTDLLVDCLKTIINKGLNFKSMCCTFLRLPYCNKADSVHQEINRVFMKLAVEKEEKNKICNVSRPVVLITVMHHIPLLAIAFCLDNNIFPLYKVGE